MRTNSLRKVIPVFDDIERGITSIGEVVVGEKTHTVATIVSPTKLVVTTVGGFEATTIETVGVAAHAIESPFGTQVYLLGMLTLQCIKAVGRTAISLEEEIADTACLLDTEHGPRT